MSTEGKPNPHGSTTKKLSLEGFKDLMTKDEMEAFAAACRIRYGTAQPEDYATLARYERTLSAEQADDPTTGV